MYPVSWFNITVGFHMIIEYELRTVSFRQNQWHRHISTKILHENNVVGYIAISRFGKNSITEPEVQNRKKWEISLDENGEKWMKTENHEMK